MSNIVAAHGAEFFVQPKNESTEFYKIYTVFWRYVKENSGSKKYAETSDLTIRTTTEFLNHYRDTTSPYIISRFDSNKVFRGLTIDMQLYSRLKKEAKKKEAGKFKIYYHFGLVYDISRGGSQGDALNVYNRMSANYKEHFENMIDYLKATPGRKLKVTGSASNIYNGESSSTSKEGQKSNIELAKSRQKEGIAFIKSQFCLSTGKIGKPGISTITYRDKDGNLYNRDQSVWFSLSDE